MPEELGHLARDLLAYNKTLGAFGRYSLATLTPAALALHRLVQAVIRARLEDQEGRWAQVGVELIDAAFPEDSEEVDRWPTCQRLLPHLLAVTEHAERLKVAGEVTGGLLHRASQYLRSRGQPRQARPLAERAFTLAQQALGPDDPKVGDRHDELGRALREAGDYQSARHHLERALAVHESAYGSNDNRVGTRHNELGLVLLYLGDLAGARTHHERALEITEATIGPDHPTMATWHSNLGTVLAELGDLTAARTHLERALAIDEAALGVDHPSVAADRGNLDRIVQELGGH